MDAKPQTSVFLPEMIAFLYKNFPVTFIQMPTRVELLVERGKQYLVGEFLKNGKSDG
ncbi:MAG: hypothetical protein ACKVRN_07920 [Pyrinomonadaceae bacterium]